MSERALARRRRHRRGRPRRALSCRAARSSRKPRSSSAARAIWRSPAARRPRRWPGPRRSRTRSPSSWRGAASRSACWRAAIRSSSASARADAPLRRRRNDLPARALGLRARRGAARLEPAGLRAALAAWPRARGDHPASAAEARGSLRCRGTTRRRAKLAALLAERGMGRSKLTVCEAMGGAKRTHSRDAGAALRSRRRRGARTRSRSKSSPSRARASCRARPACPTTGSSMTGRSPSARSAR